MLIKREDLVHINKAVDIYNIISIEPAKKRVAKSVFSNYLKKNTYIYNNVDDYLIEYKLFTEIVNGEKTPVDNFTHKSFLTEFNPTEKKFIDKRGKNHVS